MAMCTGLSALAELADAIRGIGAAGAEQWTVVDHALREWVDRPGRRRELHTHLHAMPADEAAGVVARSKETTTHFAWCLYDRPTDPFSLWLHEYKPCHVWLPGYANSVHNHRYHFCTTLLSGSYLHERFTAELNDTGTAVRSVTRTSGTRFGEHCGGLLLSHEFHRIPHAEDGTMTFLVKSRMVAPWSVSYDPDTGLSQQHIPMTTRLARLAGRL
jgi:hypothetical protein